MTLKWQQIVRSRAPLNRTPRREPDERVLYLTRTESTETTTMRFTATLSAGLRSLAIQSRNKVAIGGRSSITVQGLKGAFVVSQRSLHIARALQAGEAAPEAGGDLPATTRKTRTVRKTATTATKKKSKPGTAVKTVKKRKNAAKPSSSRCSGRGVVGMKADIALLCRSSS